MRARGDGSERAKDLWHGALKVTFANIESGLNFLGTLFSDQKIAKHKFSILRDL